MTPKLALGMPNPKPKVKDGPVTPSQPQNSLDRANAKAKKVMARLGLKPRGTP
jgi:hypothetical protein